MASVTNTMINCTPHDLHVYDEKGENVVVTYHRSQYAPRLGQEPQKQVGSITTESGKNIPVYSPQKFGNVEGLPPCGEGSCPDIIVSMLVGQKLQESGSWPGGVFGPDTGKGAVRAENGQIKGTMRLIQYCACKTLNL